MLQRILDNPFMLLVLVGALVLLHIGAYVRMRHEANLKKRGHKERRNGLRVMPNTGRSKKQRKNQGG